MSVRPLALETVDGPVDATVAVPGSKSVSNRALVCAALADGVSSVENVAPGEDTVAMIDSLRILGVRIEQRDSAHEITGCGGIFAGGVVIDARLAGTTSRFLTALGCLTREATVVTGDPPLLRRPMVDLHRALAGLGARVNSIGDVGHLPVEVSRGDLRGGRIALRGDVSSQFLSALMLIAPYLEDGLTIDLVSPLVSRPYVELTCKVMESFGVSGTALEEGFVRVPAGRYRATRFVVEPDASSASYPLAAAAIAGGRILVVDLLETSTQGDIRILEILRSMGCEIVRESRSTGVTRSGPLRGIDIDMASISDLVPTVAAVALFAKSPTRIRGVGFIRGKESNRIEDLVEGINRVGGKASSHPDGLDIEPVAKLNSTELLLRTHNDHRLAMAWSLIALRRHGVSIDDPFVVGKSWPSWWDVREKIRRSSVR